MRDLENELIQGYDELGIIQSERDSIGFYLNLLHRKSPETWEHSVRTGLLCKDIAKFIHIIEPKELYYPGLLHDAGKILTDPNSLNKKESFDKNDMKELQRHVVDGYKMLRGAHDFSAKVLLYHHFFQKEGYPKRMPKQHIDLSKGSNVLLLYCARILSIVDFYDAITNRTNNKFSGDEAKVELIDRVKAREILTKENLDQKYLIDGIYEKGIFE